MKYPRKTGNPPLILGASVTGILKWWIYASFAVRPNMRGRKSGGMSTVRGFLVVTSTEKTLNT